MFIEIKKVLKRGICVLLVTIVAIAVGVRVKVLKDNKNKEDFLCDNRETIAEAYGKNGVLKNKTLQTIREKLGSDIEKFREAGYTADEAKRARFLKGEIFKEYNRDDIVKVYGENGKLSSETLRQIKEELGNSFVKFFCHGYKAEEAKQAGFDEGSILSNYCVLEVREAYNLGKKNCTDIAVVLEKIKNSLYDDISKFRDNGYTFNEACQAGFNKEEILNAYDASKIRKKFGRNGVLDKDKLNETFEGLDRDAKYFFRLGYTLEEYEEVNKDEGVRGVNSDKIKEAKELLAKDSNLLYLSGITIDAARKLGLSDNDIFGGYGAQKVRKEYGVDNKLDEKTLKEIKQAIEEKEIYMDKVIRPAYGARRIGRHYDAPQAILYTQKQLSELSKEVNINIARFYSLGYTYEEAKLAGFSDEELAQVYYNI